MPPSSNQNGNISIHSKILDFIWKDSEEDEKIQPDGLFDDNNVTLNVFKRVCSSDDDV